MEAPDAGNWRAGNPLAPNPVKKPRPRSASPPKPTPSESPRREKWKSSAVGGPEKRFSAELAAQPRLVVRVLGARGLGSSDVVARVWCARLDDVHDADAEPQQTLPCRGGDAPAWETHNEFCFARKLDAPKPSETPHVDVAEVAKKVAEVGLPAAKSLLDALTKHDAPKDDVPKDNQHFFSAASVPIQDMPEDLVLMRVLRDSNMPKFVFEDVPLFKGLINDLFPGLDCPRVGYEDLKKEVALDLTTRGFKGTEEAVFNEQVDKVIQMYETQIVRHTTMIVGPTGGGKTVVLDTLKAARLKAEGVVVKYYVINPKAQPLNELYGVMDPVTRDWTDGPYPGVLTCCGAFTPSTRFLSLIHI